MAFLGLGWTELIIILVIVLVIFGPKRLPALGKSLGKTVKNVRDEMSGDGDAKDAAEEAAADAPQIEADVEDAEPVEVADDAKYCPECGAENPADNAFCAKCGAKLQ